MSDPIMWFRHPGDRVDAATVHYSARVRNTAYRIERDGRQWLLWIKEHGSPDFTLWDAYTTLQAAKDEVLKLEGESL